MRPAPWLLAILALPTLLVQAQPSSPPEPAYAVDAGDILLEDIVNVSGPRVEPAIPGFPAAFVFDGWEDRITFMEREPDARTFSLSLWFRSSRAAGNLLGLAPTASTKASDRYVALDADSRVAFVVFQPEAVSNAPHVVTGPPGFADDRWHHVIATAEDDVGMRLFLDGALVDEKKATDLRAAGGHWRLGAGGVCHSFPFNCFEGQEYRGRIADVRIDDVAWDPSEAARLHARGPSDLGAPPYATPPLLNGVAAVLHPRALAGWTITNATGSPPALVGSGTSADPFALRLDRDDTLGLGGFVDLDALTISTWFRTTQPGRIAGFGDSTSFSFIRADRNFFVGTDGRLRYHHTSGIEVASAELVTDGRWHHALVTIASSGAPDHPDGLQFFLDGVRVANVSAVPTGGYPGAWTIGRGGLASTVSDVPTTLEGDIASFVVWDRNMASQAGEIHEAGPNGLAALALRSPPGILVELDARPAGPYLVAHVATQGLGGTQIVARARNGTLIEVGPGEAAHDWVAPDSGFWTFEARDAQGAVVASDVALLLAPRSHRDAIIASAIAAATLAGFSLVEYLRKLLFESTADRLKDRTKQFAAFDERLGWPDGLRFVIACLIMMAFTTWVHAGGPGAFLRFLPIVGLATVAFMGAVALAQLLLARIDRAPARYRLWTAGSVSLAVSTIVARIPFGYAGFVDRDETSPAGRRGAPYAALGTIGAMIALAPIFLVFGLFVPFPFSLVGMEAAFGTAAVFAMPVHPLGGHKLFRRSRALGTAVGILAFSAYYAYVVGWLGPWGILGVGALGFILFLIVGAIRARARRRRRGSDEASFTVVPHTPSR